MSAETYSFKGHFKPIFDDLVVYKKNMLALESDFGIYVKSKVKVGFSSVDNFMQTIFFLYAIIN